MLLAQFYYAGRELLFCCGVLTAFFVFFVAEGWFDSFTLEHFADTCLRLRSFETTSLILAPSLLSSTFSGWWKLQCWLHPISIFSFFERHNGPASAAPCQEGHFWKRSETKKRILRVAQKTQIRAALQELLESLPDRMWRETMRSKCAKTEDSENPLEPNF